MVTVTSIASEKIMGIMEDQGDPEAALRIMVTGMSCSGPQYMMTLEHDQKEEDAVVEALGLRIIMDPDTASILEGSEIDYLERLDRSGFTIVNPNAQTGGGCGGNCSCGAQ